ncbi:hypothetical protein GSMA_00052, partial [Serratia marcescens subsp. marcescens ATCC 13880]
MRRLFRQRLLQIGDQIFHILYPYRQAHQLRRDAGCQALFQ